MRSEFFLSSFHKKRGESFLSQLSLLKTCLFSTRKHHARASGGAEEASAARQGSRRAAAAAREARRRRDGGEEECSHSQEEQRCQLRRQWPRQRNILASCSRHRPGHARHLWRISLRREHDSHRGPCSGAEVCNSRDARRRKRLFSSDGVSPPPFFADVSASPRLKKLTRTFQRSSLFLSLFLFFLRNWQVERSRSASVLHQSRWERERDDTRRKLIHFSRERSRAHPRFFPEAHVVPSFPLSLSLSPSILTQNTRKTRTPPPCSRPPQEGSPTP